jgi:hypothetical protein
MNEKYNSWLTNPSSTEKPARLDSKQTAKLLGFQEHDIPVLVAGRLLKPLGKPVPNATKYFAACDMDALAKNPQWLNAATQLVYDYWKKKNRAKTPRVLPIHNIAIAA